MKSAPIGGKIRSGLFMPCVVLFPALCFPVGVARAQQSGESIEVLQVRPNFYMIAGAGGNVGVQVGADGVVVVDSGSASGADAIVAAIKRITTQPIRYVINTSADPDHVGGNAAVAKAGQTCKIFKDLLRASKWWLGMNNPFDPPRAKAQGFECSWFGQTGHLSVELQLAVLKGFPQIGQKHVSEAAAQHLHRKKE